MNTTTTLRAPWLRVVALLLGFAIAAGCAKQSATDAGFKTPEDAVTALVTAMQKGDMAALQGLLGPGSEALLDSGDAVQDASDRADFLAAYAAKHALVDDGADRKVLVTGDDDWPMPVPIVKRDGRWYFDGEAGIDEMIYRRVGANELGRTLARSMVADRTGATRVTAFFDDRAPQRLGADLELPLTGDIDKVADFVRANRVDQIYIALPMASQPRILKLLDQLRDTTASIYFLPDIFLYDLIQARVDTVGGLPVVAVCETPFHGTTGVIKRLSDVCMSVFALVLTAPVMLAIAIAIKIAMPGPVLFKQRRYGLDGQEIVVWKFRTMKVTEDGEVVRQATRDDERVTPLGCFLRRTSLDELPQFFNVLQGRMSVVGPRPHAVAHNETYRKLIKGYMIRHKVKPGITGWAQVNGARGETDTVEKMKERIQYDLEYLRSWSLRFDLAIVWRTVVQALRGDDNAY